MSVDGSIADAIVTAVRGIGLVIDPGPPEVLPDASVVRMKTPSLPPKTQPPRIAVVVGEVPAKVEQLTATQKLSTWPAAVVVIAGHGRKHEDDDRSRTWRAQIEAEVFDKQRMTFADVSGFNKCEVTGKSPFDPEALDKDLVYLTLNLEVELIETLAT